MNEEIQRYSIYMSKQAVAEMLIKEEEENNIIIDIEDVSITENGMVLFTGKQKKIIDGKIKD